MPEIHDQQRGETIFHGSGCRQGSTVLQTFFQSAMGGLVGKQQVLQNLRRTPLPFRSAAQFAGGGIARCLFEFPPQTF